MKKENGHKARVGQNIEKIVMVIKRKEEKRMKKTAIAFFVALMILAGTSSGAEPIKLKFSTVVPPKAPPVTKAMKPWCELVNKESQGSLQIELFAGGVLGRNMKVYFEQLNSGVFDICFISPAYFGKRFPDIDLFNIPFTGENYHEGALATQRMFNKGLLEGFQGIEVLTLVTGSPFYFNMTFPARIPEDMRGHKARSGAKVQADLISKLGMTPIGLPINKVAESMSRKLIDAAILSPNLMLSFRVADVAKNTLVVPMGSFALLVAMNKKKYDSLPSKAKATLDKHKGMWFAKFWADALAPVEARALETLKKSPGHTVVFPTPEELKLWKAAVQPVVDDWKKKRPGRDKLYNTYMDEIKRVRRNK